MNKAPAPITTTIGNTSEVQVTLDLSKFTFHHDLGNNKMIVGIPTSDTPLFNSKATEELVEQLGSDKAEIIIRAAQHTVLQHQAAFMLIGK